MYRHLLLLITAFACIACLGQAPAQSIVLVPGTATINAGETREIDVMMEVPVGLPFQTISVQIQLSANVRVLNGTQGIKVNSAVWNLVGQKAIASNRIKFAAGSSTGGCENATCKVMTFTLEALSAGPATAQIISLETLGLAPDDSEIGFAEFGDGDYTISSTNEPPTLTKITPTSGPVSGDTPITLTGANLTGATGVSFGGTPATLLTVVSDTSVTCKTPAHVAGDVQVTITTAGGTSGELTYTYGTFDDADGDGLSDSEEIALGTDPTNPDTDSDGLSDLQDPAPLTRAASGDFDGLDGLSDAELNTVLDAFLGLSELTSPQQKNLGISDPFPGDAELNAVLDVFLGIN